MNAEHAALKPSYLRLLMAVGIISVLVILTGYFNYVGFIRNQGQIAGQAVQVAGERIIQYLDDRRDRIRLLTYSHREEVLRLIRAPQDQAAYQALSAYVAKYFPGYYAYTISDPRGEYLYHDDFGQSIGEMCRNDIRQFAGEGFAQDIYIHPGPDIYHFDLMQTIADERDVVIGVFYVSILPDMLRDILRSDQPIGQLLYLLRSDNAGLIEIGADGARDEIVGDTHLTDAELGRMLASTDLPDTRWRLAVLPDEQYFEARLYRIGMLTVMALLAVLLVAAIAMVYLKRAHKGLRHTQDMYRALVTNVEGVVWQAEATPFRFTYISPQLQQLFGHAPEAWLTDANRWFEAVHADDRQALRDSLSAVGDGKSAEVEFRMYTPEGGMVWARDLVRQEKTPEGGHQLTGIMTDITRHHDDEDRLREQARQLQAYNQELESFSYSVSHDLRGPLRSINGYCQIIEDDYADRIDDHGRGMLRRVRDASLRMGELIDALLNLTRVGRAALTPRTVDLSELAESVCQELAQIEPSRHTEWHVQHGIHVYGDPVLIRVVLHNLLDNAWKFTSRAASPRIDVEARQTGDWVEISVSDNGVGCDMQFAGKLFKPFQRLHENEEFEGTGIGLATVKRIIDRHRGRIDLHCVPGKGAVVTFSLPAAGKDIDSRALFMG